MKRMEEKKPQYLMHKLMGYKELEAFTAQKRAGSNAAYFEQLAEFTEAAPTIVASLAAPSDNDELESFLRRINTLQKRLLAVGSPTLLWLAEKAVASARSGNCAKCEDEIFILDTRVKALCAQLEEAKGEPAAGERSASDAPAAAPPQVAEGGSRPQAPIKPELFEKLDILIENFEVDDALAMLRSLMAFTYNRSIDAALAAIYGSLAKFDYEKSSILIKRLIEVTKQAVADTGKTDKKRILAIDDVPDVLNTVKSVLKDNYAVYGVTNHMAALKFLTSNTADLILLDIEMPDMDGFALLGIIRKIKAYETTPVLFLTGNVSVENIKKAHGAGGNDFMKKPIDAQVLLAKIGKYLA